METVEKKTKRTNGSVRPVPEGYHTVTPFLVVDGALRLIRFLEQAFDGKLTFKQMVDGDNERVMHATVKIGDSTIMISDTMEGMQPQLAMLYLYVDNSDTVFRQALEANGKEVREIRDEFYGDRTGAVKDEWGNTWWIATHTRDVPPDELKRGGKESIKEHEQHRL